ncbi:alpha-hydroxyketone-type quorum-sensing autoinducer synthase [Celerinatantimonas yamalensis]|uniref:Alpha-hydroxyketone-type quorum-sensing autoinducer synthase n=1 Tax=Celerinatantimonas yamalensis TaxID=559956 RepID=A0ABW9G744_9GAMM
MSYTKELPDFIQSRIDFYVDDLIKANKNGKHLVLGQRPKPNDIVLQSNDYLCLANDQQIRARLQRSLETTQDSILMSAIFLQDEQSKPTLERDLAEFVHFDHCLLSQSGWNANTSLLQAVCAPDSHVYIDFFAHMSIWEGARYAKAQTHSFVHNNCDHLRKLIQRYGPGVIAVDAVYSTIGTLAPLAELVAIAKEYDCALMVDESHSLGVYGESGRGLVAQLGLSKEVDFMTASLAKTFAYRAGVIWTNNNAAQCIPFVSYPAIFSSTMLPYELEVLDETLQVIRQADHKRKVLFEKADNLRMGLRDLGVNVKSQSQIISLDTSDERNTEEVRDYLESHGVFGAVFCRPATTKKHNIMRFSVNSSLNNQQIDHMLAVCHDAMNKHHLVIR